jgi:hypothetical protein
MRRYRIRYALLGISLAFLAPTAIAQSGAPSGNSDTYATPANPSISAPPARDSGAGPRERTMRSVNEPANALDGEPTDPRDEQPRTWCSNDPLMGKMPVECRRWSAIALSQSLPLRLRSET